MILDNPGPQKPEREYIRQNRPFTKPPFYLPVKFVRKEMCLDSRGGGTHMGRPGFLRCRRGDRDTG